MKKSAASVPSVTTGTAGTPTARPSGPRASVASGLSKAPIANMTPPAEAEEAVDMYFRKMAQVSLLTREGEVELARRIEEGERRIIEIGRAHV